MRKAPNILHWVLCITFALYFYAKGDVVSGNSFVAAALVIGGLSGD